MILLIRRFIVFLSKAEPFNSLFCFYYRLSALVFASAVIRIPGVISVYNTSSSLIPAVSDIDVLVVFDEKKASAFPLSFGLLKLTHCIFRVFAPMICDVRIIPDRCFHVWLEVKPEIDASAFQLLCGIESKFNITIKPDIDRDSLRFASAMFFYTDYFQNLFFSPRRKKAKFEFFRLFNKIHRSISKSETSAKMDEVDHDLMATTIISLTNEARRICRAFCLNPQTDFPLDLDSNLNRLKYVRGVLSCKPKSKTFIILDEELTRYQISEAFNCIYETLRSKPVKGSVLVLNNVLMTSWLQFVQPMFQRYFFGKTFALKTDNPDLLRLHLALLRRKMIERMSFSTSDDFPERCVENIIKSEKYSVLLSHLNDFVTINTHSPPDTSVSQNDSPLTQHETFVQSMSSVERIIDTIRKTSAVIG
jgi:hypothetical protein